MIWPTPDAAAVTLFAGNSVLSLPEREPRPEDAHLTPMPPPETAPPAARTVLHEGSSQRESDSTSVPASTFIAAWMNPAWCGSTRSGSSSGNHGHSEFRIRDDDPLTARAELHRSQTVARGDWRVRTELTTQLSATQEAFRVRVTLAAYEGDGRFAIASGTRRFPRDLV